MTNPRDDLMALAPCPFCGGEATVVEIEPHSHSGGIAEFMPDHPGSAYIDCVCGVGIIDASKDDVIKRWNTRAASRPAPVDREAVARLIVGPRLPVPSWSQSTLEQLQKVRWDSTPTAEQKDALNAADAILSLFRPAKAWDSATSPGMTDLMISPESLDAVGEPVAWRIRVRNGPHTYNEYTERLPFEPLVGSPVKVLGEPESLFTHPPAQPDTSAEEMRERCAAYHDALAENASGRIDDASTDTMRGLLRAVVQRHRSDAAAIRQLPTPERGDK